MSPLILLGWMIAAGTLTLLLPVSAMAAGTAAGSTISNTATVTFTLGSDPTPLIVTASNSFDVAEIIDLVLVWQDAASVPVNTPHTGRILTFLLTNTGNGDETFNLKDYRVVRGDQFDPRVQGIWLESNGSDGCQPDDTLYSQDGVTLAPDEAVVVYLVGDIPAGLADGDLGAVVLRAWSLTPGAARSAPGTAVENAGSDGVDAVVGVSTAYRSVTASYVVSTTTVKLLKSITRIVDLFGGDHPWSGARVTYRIDVDVLGSSIAEDLVVSDAIPEDMTYVAGSMTLDGAPQTDRSDRDSGDFNVTAADTVTVTFGDTVAPAKHIIEFDAIINH
jgi:uncharacterized repeat protein (TIGR01451 family)